jgi:hypothetical protein
VSGDVDPSTVTLEDISDIRKKVVDSVSLREAHRVIKIWWALWTVMAALKYCRAPEDPSSGLINNAERPRRASWHEGEAVRLAKEAWRLSYNGLAAVIAVSWDTQLSPVDVRGLTASQRTLDAHGVAFMLERAKTPAGPQWERYRAGLNALSMPISPALDSICTRKLRSSETGLGARIRRIRSAMISASSAQHCSGSTKRGL